MNDNRPSNERGMSPARVLSMREMARNLRYELQTSRADNVIELCDEIERLQRELSLAQASAQQMKDAWDAACNSAAVEPSAAQCDRCERYRDETGHYPYCPVGDGTQRGRCMCNERPDDPLPVQPNAVTEENVEAGAKALWESRSHRALESKGYPTAWGEIDASNRSTVKREARAVLTAARLSEPPSTDLALARNCLGNLLSAVRRAHLPAGYDSTKDVHFAMREAVQFLGPPYTSETKSAVPVPVAVDHEGQPVYAADETPAALPDFSPIFGGPSTVETDERKSCSVCGVKMSIFKTWKAKSGLLYCKEHYDQLPESEGGKSLCSSSQSSH